MPSSTVGVELLRNVPIFRGMNETEYRQLAEVLKAHTFNPGDFVLRQGESSRNLWVLLEGECEVTRHVELSDSSGESVLLSVLAPHQHFGEMSFFEPAPHSADVRARTAVKLLRIAHGDYDDMIREGIWVAYKLAYNVVTSLAERLRRMDQWVVELLTDQPATVSQVPEWNAFREKLFNRWSNL